MGCGSAKISLSHVGRRSGDRGGGGKRRQAHSDYSDSDPEDSDSDHHGGSQYERSRLAGGGGSSAAARSAPALVTSASVDSELQKPDHKHPKIITSFSQNDFTTTTNINGRGRIRVTLSHDGSLLEVETEMLNMHHDDNVTSSLRVASSSSKDHGGRIRIQPPVWTPSSGHRDEALPSCSGTSTNKTKTSGSIRSDISGQGVSTSEHESTSNSANSYSTPRYNDVRHTRDRGEVVTSGGCDTEDEDEAPTAGTVFITVAEIEDRPVSSRAHRSKSINSILSQAEENLRQELTKPKLKRTCKECGCAKEDGDVNDPDNTVDKRGNISVINLDKNIEKCETIANERSGQEDQFVFETSHEPNNGPELPKGSNSAPLDGESIGKRKASKIKPCSEESPSPLLIDKYVECCCYCHQLQREADRQEIRPASNGQTTSGQSKVKDLSQGVLPGQTDTKSVRTSSNGQTTSGNHMERDWGSTTKSKLGKLRKSKLFGRSSSKENGSEGFSSSDVCNGKDVKDQRGVYKVCNTHSADFSQCKSKVKASFKSRNFLGHSHDGVLSNDTIVTVPVAPIVDANAVFDFDDYEWAELALGKGSNPKKKSTSSPNKGSKSIKNKKCTSGDISSSSKEGQQNFKENKTFHKIKSLSSNQLSLASTAAASNSHSSSRFSTSDQCKCTLRRSKTTSSGSIAEMADGPLSSLSQQSVNTFMTPSLSMDSASLPSSQGSLDNPAVWLQVHADFFNGRSFNPSVSVCDSVVNQLLTSSSFSCRRSCSR